MIGKQDRWQGTLFMTGSLEELIPGDHILKRVDKVLDLSWLHKKVSDCYCDSKGRPGIDPEAAVRLMLAGFFPRPQAHGDSGDTLLVFSPPIAHNPPIHKDRIAKTRSCLCNKNFILLYSLQ